MNHSSRFNQKIIAELKWAGSIMLFGIGLALVFGFFIPQAQAARDHNKPPRYDRVYRSSDVKPDVQMEHPYYAGTGCPRGTMRASLSPDKSVLSLLFDQYIVEAGQPVGLTKARKNCKIHIPFNLADNIRVAVVKMDYRGYHYIPAEGYAAYFVDHNFRQKNGKTPRSHTQRHSHRQRFEGPRDEEVFMTTGSGRRLPWTPCGEDTELVIDSSIIVQSNSQGDETVSMLDSLDLGSSQVEFHFVWHYCHNNGSGRGGHNEPVGGRR